jgi:hypothetical protein
LDDDVVLGRPLPIELSCLGLHQYQ